MCVFLNYIFIPVWGIEGAAIATCISFIIMFVVIFIINFRLFPISYEWSRIIRILIAMSVISLLYDISNHDYSNKLMLTLYYPFVLLFTGFLYKSEIKRIKKTINLWPK